MVLLHNSLLLHIKKSLQRDLPNKMKEKKIQNAVAALASPPLEILDFNMMKSLI